MSLTQDNKAAELLQWLEENAFWNSDVLELKVSPTTSGIGVFFRGSELESDEDNLLLRIPKSNVLSPKNSVIWNLLVDFDETESEVPEISFVLGMHSIVMAFIYEVNAGSKSRWYHYLQSIIPEQTDSISNVPLCLWTELEKKQLHNTECDLLNMLDDSELLSFYTEAIKFGKCNEKWLPVPAVLDVDTLDAETIRQQHREKLVLFGKYVQTVISRAFAVDDFHGLSLVPGADLFNHRAPSVEEDGRLAGNEDVHFVCDNDDVCEACGEQACEAHDVEDEEEEEEEFDEEIDEEIDGDGEIEAGEDDNREEGDEEEIEADDELAEGEELEGELSDASDMEEENELLADSEVDEELLFSSDDDLEDSLLDSGLDSDLDSDAEAQSNAESQTSVESLPIHEITEEYIKKMEQEQENMSEQETDEDEGETSTIANDDEVSTISPSDDEKEPLSMQEELAEELADNSKCCDIVLSKPPCPEIPYELFNTYGNNLANPFLLQRYGFVEKVNPNNTCMLSLQFFKYLKRYRAENSEIKIKQLNNKLAWYEEMGFEFVNDLVCQYESRPSLEHDNCEDDCEDDCNEPDEHTQILQENLPESYQLSPRVRHDGSITPQTFALVKLLVIPYKIFYYKFIECASERKLAKRIFLILLPYDKISTLAVSQFDAQAYNLIKTWVTKRLDRYEKRTGDGEKFRQEIIDTIISQEKDILKKAIIYCDSK